VESPELVHGDLWGGNWFADVDGEPVLIDPAVHLGHGEVDLAMSELFGGFGSRFYEAYREAHGITAAYGAYRRELYQLYYLLVHVNLFGASYEAPALHSARRVVAALSG
jgi:fructosamine-3-kinase